jgi:hypothetical protein
VEAFLSREIQAGLDRARLENMKRSSRLRVAVNDEILPVLRMWKTGFSLDATAPALRGLVDLYDGSTHLFQCLIVTSEEESQERRYEFKRATAVADRPAVDFEIDANAPAALIEYSRPTEDR